MKRQHTLALSALCMAASLSAWAQNDTSLSPSPQTTPGHATHGRHASGMQQHGMRFERHMAELKAALVLRPEQEADWARFVEGVRPPPHPMTGADHDTLRKMSTPERLKAHQEMMAAMQAHFQTRAKATEAFYAALNDTQKRSFDQSTARWMMRHQPGHHHGDKDHLSPAGERGPRS